MILIYSSVLSNMIVTSHMQLFKVIKIRYNSNSVPLAKKQHFQCSVASRPNLKHFYHRKFYWTVLIKIKYSCLNKVELNTGSYHS